MYVALCWAFMMLTGFVSCSDDIGKSIDPYTEEQKKWIADNQAYFQDKKVVMEDGQLFYNQLVVGEDTLLYRLMGEAGKVDSFPRPKSDVLVSIKGILPLSKTLIIGDKDGNPIDQTLRPDDSNLIKGLSALLMETRKGEMIEAIIPYQLGYGDKDYVQYAIPLCSTLEFVFTVKEFD